MSLTRKMLKAMGIEEEKAEQIIDAHVETVNALKEERNGYKADAEKLKDVQKELDELKSKNDDGWKDKHDKLKGEFEKYKGEIEAKNARAAKEAAVRAYYESKGISGKNLEIAIRGSKTEIDAVELDGEKIKDSAALDSLISGDFSALVATTTTKGASVSTPPTTTGGSAKTKADILKIKNTTERQKAWAELLTNQKKGE